MLDERYLRGALPRRDWTVREGRRPHRNREYIVAERIRRTLPQFAGLTDGAVLDRAFALHDAQELIAMELGFDWWVELKEATPHVRGNHFHQSE